jgi:hypothetical protein
MSWKPAQMVWASIWLDKCCHPRTSQLVIMERNSNAPRGGYSAQSYTEALKKGLLPYRYLSDARYYLASSPGPIRSWCTHAGAPPCGKTTTGEHEERRTSTDINQSSSYITIIILLSDSTVFSFLCRIICMYIQLQCDGLCPGSSVLQSG